MIPNSTQEENASPDVIRHLVLLGDALQNIDLGKGQAESALVPRPRNPWKLTVLQQFESLFARLIAAATEAAVPTIVCTLVPARYMEPSQERVAAAALAIFNDRILRRTIAARLSIVDLRLICDEDSDYASETLLSHAGVRKVAYVARSALYDISRNPGRTRVYF
ncbi:MAG: hypothetical protein E6H45_09665 [Betaproteobacteria bacterium]|nr:MAG: hypothetical protein E6H45_09665 [Betaproteobacteria bacterium]